jgi:hypothetical protein
VWAEAGDEKQIDHFDGAVVTGYANGAAWRGDRQEFGMWYGKRSSIREMNLKRMKRLCPVHLSDLFDGHC